MKQSIQLVLVAAIAGCAAPEPAQPIDVLENDLKEARQLIRAEDWDGALKITDRLLNEDVTNREAWLIAADGNYGIFRSGRAQGLLFLEDATNSLDRALDLDDDDPDAWLLMASLLLAKSQFEDGMDAATTALEQYEARGAPRSKIAAAYLAIADNQTHLFVNARQAEIEAGEEDVGEDTAAMAAEVLTTLNGAFNNGAAGAASTKSADVYIWLGQTLQAVEILERGIRQNPDDSALHDKFMQLYSSLDQSRECVAAYKGMLRENRGSNILLWQLGRAQVRHADAERRNDAWAEAQAGYEGGLDTFAEYNRVQPAHHEATAQWLAICELSLARVKYEQGEIEAAKRHYDAAYGHTELVAAYDENGFPRVYDSFGGNYVGGLVLIGNAIAGRDGNAATLAYYDEIIARHPNRFGSIYNNAALAARDLGAEIAGAQRGGEPKPEELERAMALWEKSYEYYEIAVELEPNDPRIVNDCGLMLVYHLHRDYDRARELFDRTIEIGQPMIDALDIDATEAERNFLEEAVGDAWQNIGVLNDQLNKPAEEIRPYLEESLKYYPYRQRVDSLRILRRLDRGGPRGPRDRRSAAFASARREARVKADAGDYDGALLILDRVAVSMRGHAPFHYLAGLYSLKYGDQAKAKGSHVGLVDGLYSDAARQLSLAVQLEPEGVDARQNLALAFLEIDQNEKAVAEAEQLLAHFRSVGGGDDLVAHRVRALGSARFYIAQRRAEAAATEHLDNARESFAELERRDALDAELRDTWVTAEEWAEAGDAAVAILARALERSPDSDALFGQLLEVADRTSAYRSAVTVLASRGDAKSLWYLGRARFDLAQHEWRGGDVPTAVAVLDEARAAFEASIAGNPDYRDSAEQWTALCFGSQAHMWLEAEDYAKAEAAVLAGLRLRSDRADSQLGRGATMKQIVLRIGDHYFTDQDDLGKTEAFYRRVCEAAPDDVDFANNHGLFARDYGVALEKDGKLDLAKAMFEASYAAYVRASKLDPDSVRLRNDRALLLIYHLHRDLDDAYALLLSTLQDGEKRFREDPPADEAARRELEESVGDCYQNLGYYFMTVTKDYAKARAQFDTSLTYYPHGERDSTKHLEKLDELEGKKRTDQQQVKK